METLKYIVEDSILAELLGVQNFSNKESAILELVKNAFDANALCVKINISKDAIEIIDNGCGMSRNDLSSNWMHIGKSDKGYEIEDENGKKRVQAGSKGVGRFALARLGEDIVVESNKEGFCAIRWTTDWNTSTIQEIEGMLSKGTCMKIHKLRDKWSEKSAKFLGEYLGRTYNDTVMKIELSFEGQPIKVVPVFSEPKKGVNYATKIQVNYNSQNRTLLCEIESDEFLEEAQQYCKNNIKSFSKTIDLSKEYENKVFEDEISDIDAELTELGDFSAELYFSLDRVLSGDDEKFLYKRKVVSERYNSGIILYRNSFSISSYEGKKDWLGLGIRSRKSPAAATHPTGLWRVRENQISGMVKIDKKNNKYLQDLANRQGLDENKYYKLFVEIIHTALAEFERYRQTLIRDINKKNKPEEQKEVRITDKVVKNPAILKSFTRAEENKFVVELQEFKKDKQEYKRNIEETEKRYKYDVRILNVLATSGLRATSIAHELRNDRNKIDGNYEYIVKALKKYDVWEILNETENTRVAYQNVPELLEKNKNADIKILKFMDTMLEDVEEEQFVAEERNVIDLLEKTKKNWCSDYAWLDIEIKGKEQEVFKLPEDVITVIFDNLILNSIQQNEKKRKKLHIEITIEAMGDCICVVYRDDGVGISDKFKANPMKILEPHETSRKKGHGLGMWILNNTLEMSGGEVLEILDNGGFEMKFTIGGNL